MLNEPLVYGSYKVLLHVFRALNGLSPEYLAGMLEHHVPTRSLRPTIDIEKRFCFFYVCGSADSMLLTVQRIRHRWATVRSAGLALSFGTTYHSLCVVHLPLPVLKGS